MQTAGNDINIKLDKATICYDDMGNGEIPLIFIHGFPFDKSSWLNQLNYFKSSHRVIAYDIRGFGQSTDGEEKLSINLFADDLIKFMDGLEISKAIVCGLSMGGYILLNAVDRYPERFEAIILCDTQCIADTTEGKEKRKLAISEIEKDGLNNFATDFVRKIFCEQTFKNKIQLTECIREIILATAPQTITGTLNALAERSELCTTLNEIKIPVLILCGKEDQITPPTQSEAMLSIIPNAKLKLIEDAGHMSNLEQPETFNRNLNEFISDLARANI